MTQGAFVMQDGEKQWLQSEFETLKDGQREIRGIVIGHEGRISALEQGHENGVRFGAQLRQASKDWRTITISVIMLALTALTVYNTFLK